MMLSPEELDPKLTFSVYTEVKDNNLSIKLNVEAETEIALRSSILNEDAIGAIINFLSHKVVETLEEKRIVPNIPNSEIAERFNQKVNYEGENLRATELFIRVI
jgi:hypothetical protein